MTDERGDRPPAVDPAASVESLRHLAAKVLEDARGRAARGSRGEIAWFESDAEGEGAFRWWCAVLDWDVVKTRERMREAVRRSRAKREAKGPDREALAELVSSPPDGFSAQTRRFLAEVAAGLAEARKRNGRPPNLSTEEGAHLMGGLAAALSAARDGAAETAYERLPTEIPPTMEWPIPSGRQPGLEALRALASALERAARWLDVLPAAYSDALLGVARREELPFDPGAALKVVLVDKAGGLVARPALRLLFEHVAKAARETYAKIRGAGGGRGRREDAVRAGFARELRTLYEELTGEAVTEKPTPSRRDFERFVERCEPSWLNPAGSRAEYGARKAASRAPERID